MSSRSDLVLSDAFLAAARPLGLVKSLFKNTRINKQLKLT